MDVLSIIQRSIEETIQTRVRAEVEREVDELLKGDSFRPLLREVIRLQLQVMLNRLERELHAPARGKKRGRRE